MGACMSSKNAKDPAANSSANEADTATVDKEVTGTNFEDHYTLGKMIGSGTFSVVREGVHKKTSQKYAIKCIKREGLTAEDIEALTAEVAILKQMNHPNIMILHDFYTESNFYFLVTELMEGGELFDRIVEKTFYTEREARDLVKLLLEAIDYCHKNNVVHRDLKPENLLLTSKDDNASIKLADFGFAKKIEFDGEGLSTACGTPGYVAPEILQGKSYGREVDIWSIGVITYILLCGYPPFHDDNHNALFRKIKKGKYQFDSPYWDTVSDDAKDLIGKMLIVDPQQRLSAEDLLKHRWVTGTEVATVQLTSALEELRRFNARRKLKMAVKAVQAANRLNKVLDGVMQIPTDVQDVQVQISKEAVAAKDSQVNTTDKVPSSASAVASALGVKTEATENFEGAANVPQETAPVVDSQAKAVESAKEVTKIPDTTPPAVDSIPDANSTMAKVQAVKKTVKDDAAEAVAEAGSNVTESVKETTSSVSNIINDSGSVSEKIAAVTEVVKTNGTEAVAETTTDLKQQASETATDAVEIVKTPDAEHSTETPTEGE